MPFKEFFWTPIAAGLLDGLNPCFLITFAVVFLMWQRFRVSGISCWWIVFFIAVMMVGSFAFNCGFLDQLVLSSFFQIASRVLYMILAFIIGREGVRLFKEWFDMSRGKPLEGINTLKPIPVLFLLGGLFTGAVLLSMMMTLWPINAHVMTFSVYMMLPGQLVALGSLVLIYSVVSYWFVAAGFLVFRIEVKNQRLFKMVAAAILLSASLGVIDIIFMKG